MGTCVAEALVGPCVKEAIEGIRVPEREGTEVGAPTVGPIVGT